jgi:hypothetical protein
MKRGFRLAAVLLSVAALPPGPLGSEPPADGATLDSTRSTVSKWIATQDLIFREKKEWREAKELLEARIDALEQEIAAAEAKLSENETVLADLRHERSETEAGERRLVEQSSRLVDAVSTLETDVRRLHKLLPPAVQDKVDALYRRMPDDPGTARVSVGERFQNVIGILNEIHKANAEISLVTEIRDLSDGKPSEVKTVYLGLGQAYFLSARGEAGVGRPGAEGWHWSSANELAPGISQVIEILQNKGKPEFVELPVTIE